MKCKRGFYDIFVATCARYPSKIAMRIYEEDEYKCYSYSELYGVCEYIAQQLQQLNCNKGVIGLVSKTNIIIPCIAAAAHKCCTSFMFLDPSIELDPIVDDMKFTVVISITKGNETIKNVLCKPPDKCLTVFGLCICLYNYGTLETPSNYKLSSDYSFIAMTSGSTGEQKKVQVPIQCIQPNITDLTNIFHITPDDVIYFSTPLTFDPSMVEILLSCINGASLLIAPPKTEVLFPNNAHSVTVWQTTPSKFFQFSNAQIKNRILSKTSSLKILALGGEPLNGIKRLKELKHSDNKSKIFTLYGVTEMSCWACVAELDLNKAIDHEVPLGRCLSETKVVIEPEPTSDTSGRIILVSNTRHCIVLQKTNSKSEISSVKFIDTGDLAEVSPTGTIYYRGRKDDVIKRFGHKINLQFIESTVMHCPRVKACSCIWLPKPRLLVIYFSSESFSSQDLSDFLKCKLDDKHWPDRIVRVDNMPTNLHGKISKVLLSKMLEKTPCQTEPQPQSLKVRFLQEIKNVLKTNVTYDQIKNKDFFSIGGTSFLAVTMCNNISATHPEFGSNLLPALMLQSQTIDQAINSVQEKIASELAVKQCSKPKKKAKKLDTTSAATVPPSLDSTAVSLCDVPIEFIEMWTYNTGKCVDASPSLLQTGLNLYVTVGSHSGKVVVVDAMTAIVVGTLELKARVEAAVCCYEGDATIPPCGIVGAYDGTVICFTIETCKEMWRTNISSMIKSKAVCCESLVYVAAYDGLIRVIDLSTGKLSHTISIGDQAISADLVVAKGAYILLGSLGGVCASVHAASRSVAWRCTLGSPVFASPALFDEDKYVVFAEVSGEIHCRTVQKGIKIWLYSGAKGNIFSSISIMEIGRLQFQLVFGCHDHCVYSIIVQKFQPSLHWKVVLTSPVYSTPRFLSDKLILAASNNGKLTVISSEFGIPIAEYVLPGETFSSPAVYKDYIFIGCRNDLIYSLRYVLNL